MCVITWDFIKKNMHWIFASILVTMLILDYIWLVVVKGDFFRSLGLKANCGKPVITNWISIPLAYLAMAFSIAYFVFWLPQRTLTLREILINTSLISLVIYVVFDVTIGNILNIWDWKVAVEDVIWGNILYLTCSLVTVGLIKLLA